MLPDFDGDESGPPLRVVRGASKDATPTAALLQILKQIPPLLAALLSRETVVKVTNPPAQVKVDVITPTRPCRTKTCTIERDHNGRATSITFTETEN